MAVRRPATASGVAAWPRRIVAVSPGSRLVAEKTINDTISSVVSMTTSRLAIRDNIRLFIHTLLRPA